MSKELEFHEPTSRWDGTGFDGTYDTLIESCANVAGIKQDWTIGDYQGDYVYLLDGEDGKVGYVVVGYGSCSGCDALQGCSTRQDIESLRDDLCGDIRWFDSFADLLAYVNDPEINHWYFYEGDWANVKREIQEMAA